MPQILILRLEGVLQSWGTRSRWSSRDSGLFPSKSGVVGLLSCALGYPRDDARIHSLQQALTMAVRADKPGRMITDYQTITRYTGNLIAATGRKRTMPTKPNEAPDTIISEREYLQDASFTAFLSGNDTVLALCANALQSPHWQLFLGRKSCPPTEPVFLGVSDEYASLADAAERYPLREGAEIPCLCEADAPDGRILHQDVFIRSGVQYGSRRLDLMRVKGGA